MSVETMPYSMRQLLLANLYHLHQACYYTKCLFHHLYIESEKPTTSCYQFRHPDGYKINYYPGIRTSEVNDLADPCATLEEWLQCYSSFLEDKYIDCEDVTVVPLIYLDKGEKRLCTMVLHANPTIQTAPLRIYFVDLIQPENQSDLAPANFRKEYEKHFTVKGYPSYRKPLPVHVNPFTELHDKITSFLTKIGRPVDFHRAMVAKEEKKDEAYHINFMQLLAGMQDEPCGVADKVLPIKIIKWLRASSLSMRANDPAKITMLEKAILDYQKNDDKLCLMDPVDRYSFHEVLRDEMKYEYPTKRDEYFRAICNEYYEHRYRSFMQRLCDKLFGEGKQSFSLFNRTSKTSDGLLEVLENINLTAKTKQDAITRYMENKHNIGRRLYEIIKHKRMYNMCEKAKEVDDKFKVKNINLSKSATPTATPGDTPSDWKSSEVIQSAIQSFMRHK